MKEFCSTRAYRVSQTFLPYSSWVTSVVFLLPGQLLFAPIGITEEVKKVLITAIERAINIPDLMSKTQKLWYIPGYKSPTELKNLLVNDYEDARAVFKRSATTK